MQVKRRPPSRKSRLNVNSDPSSEDVPDSTVVTDRGVDPGRALNIPPTDDSLFSLHNDNKSTTSKKTQKRDLFSDEADDLLAAAENIITSSGEIPDSVLSHRDDIGTGPSVVTTRQSTSKTRATEGLFGDDEVIHPQGSKFSQSERPNTDQLPQRIGAKHSSSSDDELFPPLNKGGATKPAVKQTSDLFADNDDVDDIFGVDKIGTVGSTLPKKDKIFSSGFLTTSKSQARSKDSSQPTSKPGTAVTPPDDDDVDDIFAHSSVKVKKGETCV